MELLRDYAVQYIAVDMMHHPSIRVVSEVVTHMLTQPLEDDVLGALLGALPKLTPTQFANLATGVTHAPQFAPKDAHLSLDLGTFKRLFRDERGPADIHPAHYLTRGRLGGSKGITVVPDVYRYQ